MKTTVITTKMRTQILRRMQSAWSDMNVSTSLKLMGQDRKAADQLVIAGLANLRRGGRYEASLKGLQTDTKGTV